MPFFGCARTPIGSRSVDVAISDRTRRLLDAPILPTLLHLAAPNVVVMTVQAAVTTGEAYFLGWLGADALAGVSLTFPLVMLMQTMSAGGERMGR
jgi:Na+-driven multidrug efflux pump